jgi:hypothetical protein
MGFTLIPFGVRDTGGVDTIKDWEVGGDKLP